MDFQRRRFLRLAAAGAVAPALPRSAMALDYPVRPLRFIVGYTPGGAGDIVSRIIGQWLSERLGQPVIIENKPGAGSNISVQAACGRLYVATVQAINASLYEALPFNVLRDFTPVAGIAEIPLVMVVNPSVPAKTVAEFIAYAKANPGKISMASFGTGSSSHLAGELFKSVAGVDMTHIPYRGSAPALADVIGGRVEVMFDTLLASLPHIRSGALRGLGLTGKDRSALVPDIPAIGETVPVYRAEAWNGVAVLRGTPPEIVDRLSREIVAGVADPTIRVRLAELATTPRPLGSAEFASFMAQETDKWAKLVKLSGARPE